MKKILNLSLWVAFISIGTMFPVVSFALTGTSYNIGSTRYYSFNDGTTGKSFNIGATTYYSFSNGLSGSAFSIGDTTHYSFTEPVSRHSYDLGDGGGIKFFKPQIEKLPDVSSDILLSYCKDVNLSLWGTYSVRSTQLATECISNMCPKEGCSMQSYSADITNCVETGQKKAFDEIKDECISERAQKFLDKINEAISLASSNKSQPTTNTPISKSNLNIRLNGYILLQVQNHGEAWYVNPLDGKRYYMKDGPTAYRMMRQFGLGITDINLAKLPQEGESRPYPTTLSSLRGKILLQVESHGEAWYVNPKNGYRYYMKDGEGAYNLMRYHSLGVTNEDLEKITEGSL